MEKSKIIIIIDRCCFNNINNVYTKHKYKTCKVIYFVYGLY